MKITKAQSQENRARIVETAAALFRERGYDGVSVADLMAAAGLTHGGFYKHFGSKADLMAEAAEHGLTQKMREYQGVDMRGFVNRCPHLGVELDWQPGEFFEETGLYLICSTHGAIFEPDGGLCVAGPCRGARLEAIALEEKDGLVQLVDDPPGLAAPAIRTP